MTEVEAFDQYTVAVARESWETFRRDPVLFVIAGVVWFLSLICTLGLLAGPLQIGFIDLVRKVRAGEKPAVSTLFSRMDTLVSSSVAMFIFFALFWIGLMLFVVPGLAVLLFFSWTLAVIAFDGVGGIEAIRRSVALVRANLMHTLALLMAISLANFVGSIVILGGVITVPLGVIALTIGYERLVGYPSLAPSRDYVAG